MHNTRVQSGNHRTKILMLECWRRKDKEHRMRTESVLGNTTLNRQTLGEEINLLICRKATKQTDMGLSL